MIGLTGATGTGKSYSALLLATGIQQVAGGEIGVIDTEAGRALLYAPKAGEQPDPRKGTFNFRHLDMQAPFGPADYLAAIEHCVQQGCRTVIIDSASHMHEGTGGVLEMHEELVQRMSGGDRAKAERVKFAAWIQPKRELTRLVNRVLQMRVNLIWCFRAKQKLKPIKGGEPQDLGYMPIMGDELSYEMTVHFLLVPGLAGHPLWKSQYRGEAATMKCPQPLRYLRASPDTPQPITIDTGRELAIWASGESTPSEDDLRQLLSAIEIAPDNGALNGVLEAARGKLWDAGQRARVKEAALNRREQIRRIEAERDAPNDPDDPPMREPGDDSDEWEAAQ